MERKGIDSVMINENYNHQTHGDEMEKERMRGLKTESLAPLFIGVTVKVTVFYHRKN